MNAACASAKPTTPAMKLRSIAKSAAQHSASASTSSQPCTPRSCSTAPTTAVITAVKVAPHFAAERQSETPCGRVAA